MSDIVYNEIVRLEAEKLLREASMEEIRNEFLERRYKKVKTYEEYLKEKAAMDCQRQLLLRLKEKVDGVSERLASERSVYVAKQCNLQEFLSELQLKQGRMLDTISILES
ncbi:hypothetical protein D5086_016415 [Populus alba]|uniref:Uncharacterized protein n=2 Tax=Populus alba TaxID=43335 RepID=A0ACC4BTW9_POPAL|nr:hypothetical protein D5086_0000253320 [Populus alba]